MDFAQGSGTFSGNFIDFQNNNTSLFKVTSAGVTSIGFSTSQASTSAVCSTLANATAPTASTLYELRDCGAAPAADYAEMYPVEEGIEFGDIVAVGSEMVKTYDITNGSIDWNKEKGDITKLVKSDKTYQSNVIGIVSDNYGDFSSTGNNIKEENNPMPVALSGRVPVKIASDSEPIYPGDYITTSNELGKGTKATKAGSVIGKALGFWTPESTSGTVMVYVEQGYYDGDSTVEKTFSGLTFFNADVQFMSKVTFGSEVEFKVPPMFNKDTAGFAVVKTGANKVDITFDTPYIATPIVNTSISFEEGDNVNEASAAQFFGEDIKFIVINKSKNGFTIILNKNASNDVHFSWTALQVKDAKIFESTIPGLIIEIPTISLLSSDTENQNSDTVNNTDSNSASNETVNDTTNNSGEPEIIIEEATGENTPARAPTPEPEITVIETPAPQVEAPQVESPAPEAPQTETQA